ncbi:MAG: hypothetical protein ABJN35_10130 [Erythrobacter sp.]
MTNRKFTPACAAIAVLAATCSAIFAAPLAAKDSLGVYSNWAAFRDDTPSRCYAIAKPQNGSDNGPFASIANWPGADIRGQLHIRLSRTVEEGADVTLSIADRRFGLVANGRNAWASDARMDAAIVAALRSAGRMSISARATSGGRFTDRYDLSGAATAIDAAVVGCANIE